MLVVMQHYIVSTIIYVHIYISYTHMHTFTWIIIKSCRQPCRDLNVAAITAVDILNIIIVYKSTFQWESFASSCYPALSLQILLMCLKRQKLVMWLSHGALAEDIQGPRFHVYLKASEISHIG